MLEEFQQKLGYTFKNPQLLQNALTHSSYANEHKREGMGSNERLEFLGDAILGLVVAEYLYRTHPDKPEGELTKLRAELVCEKSLYEVATRLELGKVLRLGHGESHGGGSHRPSMLADAVEAVLAASYLDGGMEEAEKVVRRFLAPLLLKEGESRNFKGELQEFLQARGQEKTVYTVVKTEGAPHAPLFTVCAEGAGRAAFGKGHSKAEAEKAAARALLFQLQNPSGEN